MVVPVDNMLGRVVSGRTIKRKLGEGGMGSVYLAEHAVLNKPFVVKVLHPEIVEQVPEAVDRLFQEAQAASRLAHHTVIDVIDCGRFAEDGRPFIVMEFVPGVDLEDYCQRVGQQYGHPGRIPLAIANPIVLQFSDGLRAVHAGGIIHRDLKLSNVMVVADGAHGVKVKILDFGICRAPDSVRVAERTATGQTFGTPGYMPPEQARGQPIDVRVDVYAVGVMLYRMLTGVAPFAGVTPGDVFANQLMVQPVPPHVLVPEIPVAISELILECLAVDPARRPATITEVASRWINAVPGAREIAERIARELLSNAGTTDPTVRAALPSSTSDHATRQRTTGTPMAGAVGAAPTMPPPTRRRWGAPAVAIVGGSVVGVGAVLLFARSDGDSGHGAPTDSAPVAAVPDAGALAAAPPPDSAPLRPDAAPHPVAPDAAPQVAVVPDAGIAPDARVEEGRPRDDDRPAKKGTGTLTVKASPWADVWIDGKYKGSTPVTVNLPEGRHTVKLKKPDADPETIKVKVQPGRPTVISRQ